MPETSLSFPVSCFKNQWAHTFISPPYPFHQLWGAKDTTIHFMTFLFSLGFGCAGSLPCLQIPWMVEGIWSNGKQQFQREAVIRGRRQLSLKLPQQKDCNRLLCVIDRHPTLLQSHHTSAQTNTGMFFHCNFPSPIIMIVPWINEN
jgi:hypothetical protein